ncbi:MAG: hypothetical protein M3Y85_07600 [Bacteroidota bacterium]|nr:hypothetical protein [Bacteroidota bacterium]
MINNFSDFSNEGDTAIEQRLWDYIDGQSKEVPEIEKLITENSAWKAKYIALLEVHNTITAAELEQPSLRFSKNVMEEIARYQITPAAKKYINSKIIWGITAFFFCTIAGFFVYGLLQIDWSADGNTKSTLGFDISNMDYSKIFNNSYITIFMMLNIVLGLALLDHYLNSRRKQMRRSGY